MKKEKTQKLKQIIFIAIVLIIALGMIFAFCLFPFFL